MGVNPLFAEFGYVFNLWEESASCYLPSLASFNERYDSDFHSDCWYGRTQSRVTDDFLLAIMAAEPA
jgi:hypothetical protein